MITKAIGKALLGKALGYITGTRYTDTKEVDIEKARLSTTEARGTLRQRNWRPDWMYRLRILVSWYAAAPFISYGVEIVNHVSKKNIPVLDWQLVWSTTGVPLFVLTTTAFSIYTGGRSWEKVNNGESPAKAVVDSFKEVVMGRKENPTVERNPSIKTIDGIDVAPDFDVGVVTHKKWSPARVDTHRRAPSSWEAE